MLSCTTAPLNCDISAIPKDDVSKFNHSANHSGDTLPISNVGKELPQRLSFINPLKAQKPRIMLVPLLTSPMSPVRIIPILRVRNREKPTFHTVQRLTRANCYLQNLKKTTFDEKKFKTGVIWRKTGL